MSSGVINRITDEDIENFAEAPSLENYQRIATKSAIYPGRGSFFGFSYCAHKLAGEAGELNEHFGKAMRDDRMFDVSYMGHSTTGLGNVDNFHVVIRPLTDERRNYLIKEIGDVLWYLSALCNELGTSLFSVAMMNLRKLKTRTDNNTLQGSGDTR